MNISECQQSEEKETSLKLRTARTLKWNSIDRISSQILYAVIGIVLANLLSENDFGLVGAILTFQAFATIFVDSGFGAALLQQKNPTESDYSTVFWFNIIASIFIYVVLFAGAPIIAAIFQNDGRLIHLSRVMFLTFVINGLGSVQTVRLMKRMDVRMVAVSNISALVVSGMSGIWLALAGYGVWALVWQSVIMASVKSSMLWITGRWYPKTGMHLSSLRKIYRVGMGVLSSSFLNTLFLNIYSFVIGAWYNLAYLGIYTQADKWSKMGSASISQILTSSFVPVLSRFQDDMPQFRRMMRKMNSFTAFIVFPFMGGLAIMATPIFHFLFGNKWDMAIPLFQILAIRGIFTVLTSLYNNYLLALGHARSLVLTEFVKDILIILAIICTVGSGTLEALVWGQFAAGVLTWIFMLFLICRNTGIRLAEMVYDLVPYAALTTGSIVVMYSLSYLLQLPVMLLFAECITGIVIYCGILKISGSDVLKEAIGYIFGRFRRRH